MSELFLSVPAAKSTYAGMIDQAATDAARFGFKGLRFDCGASTIAATRAGRSWTYLDQWLTACRTRGLKAMVNLFAGVTGGDWVSTDQKSPESADQPYLKSLMVDVMGRCLASGVACEFVPWVEPGGNVGGGTPANISGAGPKLEQPGATATVWDPNVRTYLNYAVPLYRQAYPGAFLWSPCLSEYLDDIVNTEIRESVVGTGSGATLVPDVHWACYDGLAFNCYPRDIHDWLTWPGPRDLGQKVADKLDRVFTDWAALRGKNAACASAFGLAPSGAAKVYGAHETGVSYWVAGLADSGRGHGGMNELAAYTAECWGMVRRDPRLAVATFYCAINPDSGTDDRSAFQNMGLRRSNGQATRTFQRIGRMHGVAVWDGEVTASEI